MKCTHIKDNGEQCQANAMDSGLCWTHDPAIPEEEKKAAQARGGMANAITIGQPLPPMVLEKPQDAVSLLSDTITRVRSGQIDIKVANCIGVLTGHLLKAFEVAQISGRMEMIERVVMERRVKGIPAESI